MDTYKLFEDLQVAKGQRNISSTSSFIGSESNAIVHLQEQIYIFYKNKILVFSSFTHMSQVNPSSFVKCLIQSNKG